MNMQNLGFLSTRFRPEPLRRVLAALLCVSLSASFVRADDSAPGSLLLFPEYISGGGGTISLITVTNTDPLLSVSTMWFYVDGNQCTEFNRVHHFTPGDTLTLVASFDNPNQGEGYLAVWAVDEFNRPIAFNNLIGAYSRLNGISAITLTMEPVAFLALSPAGSLTDLNQDGQRDLDGLEYSMAPARLSYPRFIGQRADRQSELVLLNMTGGLGYTAVVNFLIYNDNEEVFSSQFTLQCWERTPLSNISGVFNESFLTGFTNQDPSEPLGFPSVETGWFSWTGSVAFSDVDSILDPVVLGFLIEASSAGQFSAELPFGTGQNPRGSVGIGAPLQGAGPSVRTGAANPTH